MTADIKIEFSVVRSEDILYGYIAQVKMTTKGFLQKASYQDVIVFQIFYKLVYVQKL